HTSPLLSVKERDFVALAALPMRGAGWGDVHPPAFNLSPIIARYNYARNWRRMGCRRSRPTGALWWWRTRQQAPMMVMDRAARADRAAGGVDAHSRGG